MTIFLSKKKDRSFLTVSQSLDSFQFIILKIKHHPAVFVCYYFFHRKEELKTDTNRKKQIPGLITKILKNEKRMTILASKGT